MVETRVPLYIDAYARHDSRAIRALVNGALAGQEGVLAASHLRVSALATPGPQIRVAPGVFAVNNTAVGGDFETYLDKLSSELTVDVTATDGAAGGRSDLVIARIKNPYPGGVGTGNWNEPADRENGPYWDVDVITGVPPRTVNVHRHNPAWTAITLARITRPANTGIVQQSHILDLRSLIDLAGQRVDPEDGSDTAPPLAEALFVRSTALNALTSLPSTTTAWTDWPAAGSFDVPVPAWAQRVEVQGGFNPQFDNDTWGEHRLTFGGTPAPNTVVMFDHNRAATNSTPQQMTTLLGGWYDIPSAQRGVVLPVRLQPRLLDPPNHPGQLGTRNGVIFNLMLAFKRYPA